MANVFLRFATQGYSKVKGELSDLDRTAQRMQRTFMGVGGSAAEATPPTGRFFGAFAKGAETAAGAGMRLVGVMAQITTVASGLVTAAGGIAAALGTKLAKDMLTSADAFERTRLAFTGLLGSEAAANRMVRFAEHMATKMPGTIGDIFEALQAMASIPALEGIFKTGDEAMMERLMRMLTGLQALTGKSLDYLMIGLREAMSGGAEGIRSLERRLDIPIEAVAAAGKTTAGRLAAEPRELLGALMAYTEERAPAELLEKMNRQLGRAVENVGDLIERFGRLVAASGVYDLMAEKINSVADALRNLFDTGAAQELAAEIGAVLSSIVETVSGIFTTGIDWEGIGSLGDLGRAFARIAHNAVKAFTEFWESNREAISTVMQGVIEAAAEVLKFAVKNVFFPVGQAIGEALVEGLWDYLKQHPIIAALGGLVLGGVKGMALGGPWGALIGAAAGGVAGVAPWGISKIFGEEKKGSVLHSLETASQRLAETMDETRGRLDNVIRIYSPDWARARQEERYGTAGPLPPYTPPKWAPGFETELARETAILKESAPFIQALVKLRAEKAKEDTLWAAGLLGPRESPERAAREAAQRLNLTEESGLRSMLGMTGVGPAERMEVYKALFRSAAARRDVISAEMYYRSFAQELEAGTYKSPFEKAQVEFKETFPMMQTLQQLRTEQFTERIRKEQMEATRRAEEDAHAVAERMYRVQESGWQRVALMEGAGPQEKMEAYKNLFQLAVARKDVFGAETFYENYMKEFTESMKRQAEDRKEDKAMNQERNELLREIKAGIHVLKSASLSGSEEPELNVAVNY